MRAALAGQDMRGLMRDDLVRALIDRVLPRRSRTFLLAVGTLAVACWAAGLALTTDAHAFLTSREWQLQPLFSGRAFHHAAAVLHHVHPLGRRGAPGHADGGRPPRHPARTGPRGHPGRVTDRVALQSLRLPGARIAKGSAKKAGASGVGPAAEQLPSCMWCVEWLRVGLHLGPAGRLPVPDATGHRRLPLPLVHRGRAAREAVSPFPGHERPRRHHRARVLHRQRGLQLVHGRGSSPTTSAWPSHWCCSSSGSSRPGCS